MTASAPNHRDLYLLILGLLAGVLLGPGVLGRVAPASYQRLFRGDQQALAEAARKQTQFTQAQRALLASLAATGVTETAIVEKQQELARQHERDMLGLEAQALAQRHAHHTDLRGRLLALLLAVAVFMAVEAALDPGLGPRWAAFRRQLISVRYALLAIWLAITLAQLEMLRQVPAAFLGAVLLVATGAALGAMALPARAKADA